VSATWPDASGRFELVLPASARGLVAKVWESDRQFFSTSAAKPGAKADPAVYPTSLGAQTPQALLTVKLPQ
jgi:hypothetical protein